MNKILCLGIDEKFFFFKKFIISWRNDIKTQNNMCLDINDSSVKAKITLYNCHNGGGNQLWHYDHVYLLILLWIFSLYNQSIVQYYRKKEY